MGAATSDGRSAAEPDDTVILLTRNEIRRLFIGLRARVHPVEFQLHWSRWRRHHQAVARPAIQATAE
jgi:hypothetical protein